MTINVLDNSLKNALNLANPNGFADAMRVLKFGNMLRANRTFLRKKAPAADAGSLATLQAIVLADDGKASSIERAYARTATAGQGELTVVAYGATPATGQIAVGPNGNLVVLASDAILSLDVSYHPDKYDLAEVTLPVAANAAALPVQATAKGVIMLLEVIVTAGTATGKKIVLVPGAGAPAAGQARLNLAKDTVSFAAADAVTAATFKLALVPDTDVDALLTNKAVVA